MASCKKTVGPNQFVESLQSAVNLRESAKAMFGRHFPGANGADHDGVGFFVDGISRSLGKSLIAISPPDGCVGVEDRLQH